MATILAEQGTKYGRWTWNLRFSHTALRHLQMTCGSLTALSAKLMTLMGPGGIEGDLPEQTAALLVWAGESWRSPKLTPAKVTRRFAEMHPFEQQNLITWAVADYLKATLTLLDAQVQKLALAQADDDE